MQSHKGEGVFPTFSKGTSTLNLKRYTAYQFWSSCEIDGYKTYIANYFLSGSVLNRNFKSTELIVQEGDVMKLLGGAIDWAFTSLEGKRLASLFYCS